MEKTETKKVVPKNAIEPSTQKSTDKTPQKQDGDTGKEETPEMVPDSVSPEETENWMQTL